MQIYWTHKLHLRSILRIICILILKLFRKVIKCLVKVTLINDIILRSIRQRVNQFDSRLRKAYQSSCEQPSDSLSQAFSYRICQNRSRMNVLQGNGACCKKHTHIGIVRL
jgi:predicted GTPase